MGDLAGLDVGWRMRKSQGIRAEIADTLCEQGRYGQKTGKGFYLYEAGSRAGQPDPEVEQLIVAASKRLGIARRPIDKKEIVERLIFPMINEGARILEEGIALRSGDIDVIWVYGYGFPRWRGGPMFYADTVGLALYPRPAGGARQNVRRQAPRAGGAADEACRRELQFRRGAKEGGLMSAARSREHPWEQSYPANVRWDAPIETTTLQVLLDRAVEAFGERPALEYRGRRISYRELGEHGGARGGRLHRPRHRPRRCGGALSSQHALSPHRLFRRAARRRARGAFEPARCRARADLQAQGQRRAHAGDHQSVPPAAGGAQAAGRGPYRPADRRRRQRLGRGGNAARAVHRKRQGRFLRPPDGGGENPRALAGGHQGRHRAAAIYRRHHRPAQGGDADAMPISPRRSPAIASGSPASARPAPRRPTA